MVNQFGIIENWERVVLVDDRRKVKAIVLIGEHEGKFYFGIDVEWGNSGWSCGPGPKWGPGDLTRNNALSAAKKYIKGLALKAAQENPEYKTDLEIIASSCEPASGYLF